jgi:hypothetical protein
LMSGDGLVAAVGLAQYSSQDYLLQHLLL